MDDRIVRKCEDEFINHLIYANGTADQLHHGVLWIAVYKVVLIEGGQSIPADTACHLG